MITFHRNSWRLLCVLGAGLGAVTALPATVHPAPERSPAVYARDSRLQERITVRVTGMAIAELLKQVSAELGVNLRPAATEVEEVKVAVFVDELPAARLLDALTGMLNLTDEQGFGWRRVPARQATGYELYQEARARQQTAQRLRQWNRELEERFYAQIQKMRDDPQLRQRMADPQPLPRLGRATALITSLTAGQLDQLWREGILVLRQPDVPPEQQAIMRLIAQDLVTNVQESLKARPESTPRYVDLKPADQAVVLRLLRRAEGVSIQAFHSLGPYKGGEQRELRVGEGGRTGEDRTPGGAAEPIGGAVRGEPEKLSLNSRSWGMPAVIVELARSSGTPLVSDCYALNWGSLKQLSPAPLTRVLEEIDHRFQVNWERRDGILLMRSRLYFARQAREVPPSTIARWTRQITRDRAFGLDTLLETSLLDATQLDDLHYNPELWTIMPFIGDVLGGLKPHLLLYALLTPPERAQVARGGFRLAYDEMSPAQRQQFATWLLKWNPTPRESDYRGASVAMRLTPEPRWEFAWMAAGDTGSSSYYLAVDRDSFTGKPLPAAEIPAEMLIGLPAPSLNVTEMDNRPRTLAPSPGHSLLVHFRPRWVMNRVSKAGEHADIEILEKLIARRPELAERIALVVPTDRAEAVKEWRDREKVTLATYADLNARAVDAYGRGALPRAVLIGTDGKVQVVRSGGRALTDERWEHRLR